MRGFRLLSALGLGSLFSGAALAQEAAPAVEGVIGKPHPAGIGFQVAASELAADIHWLDGMVTWIMAFIVLLVVALIAIVIVRYNRRANPVPKSFTHNTPVEVSWTLVPILVLVVIGAFSLPVLFNQQEIPEGDITIKVTGHQWYWTYEYVDEAVLFDAYMIGQPATVTSEDEADGVQPYRASEAMRAKLVEAGYNEDEFLLATDNQVVVPVGATIVMQVTADDVIHSWTVPAFGVKQDAVPGRIAQLWFQPTREGVFFGQCSELCGKDHAYMPIAVRVVSQEDYQDWLAQAQEEFPA